MEKCSGPCLKHCYSDNKFTYIMIGIFIGLFFGLLFVKTKN